MNLYGIKVMTNSKLSVRTLLIISLFSFCVNVSAQNPDLRDILKMIKKGEISQAREEVAPIWGDSVVSDDPMQLYVAGKIEFSDFEKEKQNYERNPRNGRTDWMLLSKQLFKGYDLMSRALDLSGKTDNSLDDKYIKDIRSTLNSHHDDYFQTGGIFYSDKKYPEAYKAFMIFSELPKTDIADKRIKATSDSTLDVGFYNAAVAAYADKKTGKTLKALMMSKNLIPADTLATAMQLGSLAFNEEEDDSDFIIPDVKERENRIYSLSKLAVDSIKGNSDFFIPIYITYLVKKNQSEEAQAFLDSLIAKPSASPRLMALKGYVYDCGNEDDLAVECYKKAAAMKGADAGIYKNAALKCFKSGNKKWKEIAADDHESRQTVKEDLILYSRTLADKAWRMQPGDKEIKDIKDMIDYSVERFYK